MTMTVTQSVITIAAVVLGTMTTRFLPFLVFPEGREPPAFIRYLGAVLPYAVIGLLLVYCLKDAVFASYHALPELIAIAVTAALQRWKRNMLLSLFAGTALYMLLRVRFTLDAPKVWVMASLKVTIGMASTVLVLLLLL